MFGRLDRALVALLALLAVSAMVAGCSNRSRPGPAGGGGVFDGSSFDGGATFQ